MLAINNIFIFFTFIILSITLVSSTQVKSCGDSLSKSVGASRNVTISNCEKPRCKLVKNKSVSIKMLIEPEKEIKSLTNYVTGTIVGLPLPFIGVDSTNACGDIYDAEGTNKVGCPLKPGITYTFSRSFPIEPFYPTTNVEVTWRLFDGKENIKCFIAPSKIVDRA